MPRRKDLVGKFTSLRVLGARLLRTKRQQRSFGVVRAIKPTTEIRSSSVRGELSQHRVPQRRPSATSLVPRSNPQAFPRMFVTFPLRKRIVPEWEYTSVRPAINLNYSRALALRR
ncbi:hypothetical protein HZH66_006268 [Vespula vulgaris]|uniref:Uncharacterized protein n=1 Tax=Vespula vulgaris TaxID=7454 RepID=A0A834K6T1_VESVU|nr:hypothetical protein HZH66_006268 [Vespula vulgaris]